MKFDIATAKAEIRIWDDAASETFFVSETQTYNKYGERTRKFDFASIVADADSNEAAIVGIISEFAVGYDGDSDNIRAEITRLK